MRDHKVFRYCFFVWTLLLFSIPAAATVYSDAENGITGWQVSDNTPSGASITSIVDATQDSQVIQTNGEGSSNAYLLGSTNATSGWNNSSEFLFSWDMSTDESYFLTLHIDTELGKRRIVYSKSNADGLKNPGNDSIWFGLGSAVIGDGWNSYSRDLEADVRIGEPGNQLLAVYGVDIRGSVRLDNIALSGGSAEPVDDAPYTVYSDAETGTDGWIVFDATPAGASVFSVFDTNHDSQVIETVGDGRSNIYLIGGTDAAAGWNNDSQFALSWDMATNEAFALTVYIDTDFGVRRLAYNQSNSDSLKSPGNNSIRFGLGSAVVGSGWTSFSRDLAADVALGEPGNTLLAVNGVALAGSYRLDNLRLANSGSTPDTPDVPDTPDNPDPPGEDLPPSAAIMANSVSGTAPLSITFTSTGSAAVAPATIVSYEWEFGNGAVAASSSGSVVYDQNGTYIASLTITDSNGLTDTAMLPIVVQGIVTPEIDATGAAAARLLAQATFGATLDDIADVRRLGIDGWVDNQLTLQGQPHLEYVMAHPGSSSNDVARHQKWLIDAIDGDDQLRQRVAFALSQILVVSDLSQSLDREQYAMTNYYDILRNNAFGNYRDLLEDVTLSPIMGIFLSMLQNGRGDPATNTRADENFAREIMQLFTIGLYQLNNNGTIRRDSNGDPLPAYTQADVEEYARVYTGWTYADADRFDRETADPNTNKILPMRPFPGFHDIGAKTLLGGVVSPAGISPEADLNNALDSLFNHPNVGPFIGMQLIKRLVTSNPSTAYVGRVANAFNNNGAGERGDLSAVVRAVLLDSEARSGYANVPNYGKLREPLIRWTHLWRAFNVQRGRISQNDHYNTQSPYIDNSGSFLGQSVLSALSVFNFFHPDYAPLGDIRDAGLVAPEAEIYSDSNILTTTAKLSSLSHIQYQGANPEYSTLDTSYIDITAETELASDPGALISRLDLLLMSGQMSEGMRAVLLNHMNGLPSDEAGRSLRVRDGITLIMASPQYLVQK